MSGLGATGILPVPHNRLAFHLVEVTFAFRQRPLVVAFAMKDRNRERDASKYRGVDCGLRRSFVKLRMHRQFSTGRMPVAPGGLRLDDPESNTQTINRTSLAVEAFSLG